MTTGLRRCRTAPRALASLRHAAATLAYLAIACAAAGAMAADAFPDRPVRVIVGTPAGSTFDFVLRTMSERMRTELGQPIVIEYRVGADQIFAARQVAAAPPDGYMILAATRTQMAVNPATYATLGYDVDRDFLPLTLLGYQISLVAVHPSLPVHTLAELATYSRARPGTLNYGAGSGSFMIAGESLKAAIGADLVHIPYNGIAPTMNALLAGDVQVALVDVTVAAAHIRAGRLRALVVSGQKRYPPLPDVPTFAESGYPSLDLSVWIAMYAPAGTPEATAARLRGAIARTLDAPEVAEKLVNGGVVPVTSTPEQLRELVRREQADVAALVKRLGLAPK